MASCPHDYPRLHPQRREPAPGHRLRHLPAARRGGHRVAPLRDRGGLPAPRHGGELREREGGRRGDPPLRRAARGDPGGQQDPRAAPRVRRRDRLHPRLARAARCRLPRPAPDPLAEPERRPVRRGVARAGRPPRAGPGAQHRRLELHRGAPRADHRRDRGDPGGQPGRAAPLLRPARAARGARAARDPHRGVEPDGQEPDAVPRAAGGRGRRARTASPPARWSCAGTSSSARWRSPSRARPSGSARTSTCSASSSATEMAAISGLTRPTAAGSAGTRRPTRRCEPAVPGRRFTRGCRMFDASHGMHAMGSAGLHGQLERLEMRTYARRVDVRRASRR